MSIALSIILLSFLVPIVTGVAISVQPSVTIGDSANVSWNLDGGQFQSLNLNLRFAGDSGPRKLATIIPQDQPNGVTAVLFPSSLTPGSYHLETTIFGPTGEVNVGTGPVFTLVLPTVSTSPSDTFTPSSTTEQTTSASSSHTFSTHSSESSTDQISTADNNTTSTSSHSATSADSTSVNSTFAGSNFVSTSNSETGQGTASITGPTQTQTPLTQSDPTTTSTIVPASLSESAQKSSKTPMIAGSVVGAIVALALLALVLLILARRRRNRNKTTFYRERMVRTPGTGTPIPSVRQIDYGADGASSSDLAEKHPLSYEYAVEGHAL